MEALDAAIQCYMEFDYAVFGWSDELKIGYRIMPEETPFTFEVGQPFVVISTATREEADRYWKRFMELNTSTKWSTPWSKQNFFYKAVTE